MTDDTSFAGFGDIEDARHARDYAAVRTSSLSDNEDSASSYSGSGSGSSRRFSTRFSKSRSLRSKKARPERLLSPAERDLRLLSSKAAESYRQTKIDRFLEKTGLVVPYLTCIMLLTYSIPVCVLTLEELDPGFAEYGRWVWRITVFLTICITTPMWIAMMQWRPTQPLNGDPLPNTHLPTVDIAICSYKEDVGEVVDTIVACQRVEYPAGLVHVYLLDDGRRKELDDACEDLHRSGLLRHPLTYVDRPTNEGKKAGNINNWLNKYEYECGEFFIILDADMQPFPDMLDILVGHYLGLSKDVQDRCAYVQAPQWYRNYNGKAAWTDVYNISEFFFYRMLQPANSTWGCTVYVGCCALWKRQAIESVGGFIGGYATEDSVTGCQVNRTLVPGTNTTWHSKYVMQPIAAGVSPETLPALLEQRLRWYKGLCEMFGHHNGYLFASGLSPMQRLLYWVTSASYIANIINYVVLFVGTMVLFASIIYYAHLNALGDLAQWGFWGGPAALGGTILIWSFIPGCSFVQYAHTMSTAFLYTPVYVAAVLNHYCGFNIKVQTTAAEAAGGVRRWSKFFFLPLVTIGCVSTMAVVALWQIIVTKGDKPITPILQIPVWLGFWVYAHYHVVISLMGFSYSEISFYSDEAAGNLSDPNIKAHLRRHVAQIDPDSFLPSLEEPAGWLSSQGGDTTEDEAVARAIALGMAPEERTRVLANLSVFQARRRAVTETIIAETFARGDNTTFSGQNGLKADRNQDLELHSMPSFATMESSASIGRSGSIVFERKLLAAVQLQAGGAKFNGSC